NVLLSHEFFERAGAHALGQGTLGIFGFRGLLEQAAFVGFHGAGRSLWRRASYRRTAQATAAFSDSTPRVGMRTEVDREVMDSRTPLASPPTTMAHGRTQSAWSTTSVARGPVANSLASWWAAASKRGRSSTAVTTGTRKMEPA